MVGKPADRDDVGDAECIEKNLVARDKADAACPFERLETRRRRPIQKNRSGFERVQARNRAQQRRLADSVGAEQRDELARSDARGYPAQERPTADVKRDVAEFDHRPRLRLAPTGRR